MKIQPLTPYIGALIEDIELSTLTSVQFKALHEAFLRYKVVFFRNQSLTPLEHMALAKRFGELEPVHPFFPHLPETDQVVVIETSRGNPPGESYWHTDLSWQEIPCRCSVLHAQHCPLSGGDTIWTSMQAVWQSLSVNEQSQLRGLTVQHGLHAFEGSRYDTLDDEGNSYVAKESNAHPPVVHPLVISHPDTGKESLFINEQFSQKIIELSDKESDLLLNKLYAFAREERFQVRFSWQPHSVAIWDNLSTQHFAVTDYGDQPRRLHRVTVQGKPLFGEIVGYETDESG